MCQHPYAVEVCPHGSTLCPVCGETTPCPGPTAEYPITCVEEG